MHLSTYDTYSGEELDTYFPRFLARDFPLVRSSDREELLVIGTWSRMPYSNGSYFPAPTRYVLAPTESLSTILMVNRKPILAALSVNPPELVVFQHQLPDRGIYVGRAILGAAASNAAGGLELSFSLENKLPWDVWQQVGGYVGWQLLADGQRYYSVNCREDFSILAKTEFSKKVLRLVGERYEGDRVEMFLQDENGFVMYLTADRKDEYVTQGSTDTTREPFVFLPIPARQKSRVLASPQG